MQLHRDRDRFRDAGVDLVVIGQGTAAHAADFKRTREIGGLRLLVDPERRTYAAAGAKRATLGELFSPRVLARAVRTTVRSRVVQGMTDGDAAQLGGVLVVAPDARVLYAHAAGDASDNPTTEEILADARQD